MAIGVDISKRKPRQLRGTPSRVISNRFVGAVLTTGVLIGVGWHKWSLSENIRHYLSNAFLEEPEGEIERRALMGSFFTPSGTPEQLRKMAEERERIDQPHNCQGVTISKYFAEKEQMDNSIQDFQDSKKTKKPKQIVKRGKQLKRDKKQKDIRTVLNGNKNKLLSYNKEFQDICLQSGIDVDSEQLQIAIALSKSLQESENNSTSQQDNQSKETTESTSKKIRNTLREYGFHVPEKTSTLLDKKRTHRKSYELLNSSITVKKQRVADKLSEVLLNFNTSIVDTENCAARQSSAFSRTGDAYDLLKNNAYFYTDLFDVAPDTTGCLLRDWSKIPGRPASPVASIVDEHRFSQYVDNQDDLDIILSGTMEVVEKLVRALKTACSSKMKPLLMSEEQSRGANHNLETFAVEDVKNEEHVQYMNQICQSPDIFADEPTLHNVSVDSDKFNLNFLSGSLKDTTLQKNQSSPEEIGSSFCTEVKRIDIIQITESPDSEPNNDDRVKNRSSEFTKEIKGNNSEHLEIVLTQEENPAQNMEVNSTKIDSFDLTQSSNSSEDSLPFINFGSKDNDTIQETNLSLHNTNHCIPSTSGMSHHIEHKIPISTSPEIISSNDSNVNINISSESVNEIGIVEDIADKNSEVRIDLTQSTHSRESYLLDSPDENDEEVSNIYEGIITGGASFSFCRDFSEDKTIDYEHHTINLSTRDDIIHNEHVNQSLLGNNHAVIEHGKADLVNYDINHSQKEISYSEKLNCDKETNMFESNDNDIEPTLKLKDMKFNDKIVSQCPTDVFNISDEELDYSMQYYKKRKSKKISIQSKDDIDVASTSFQNNSHCLTPKSLRRTKSFGLEISLPKVEMNNVVIPKKAIPQRIFDTPDTPVRKLDGTTVCTPGNTKYIYKIDNVTPMTNYATLDTPKVNMELEKYGIKPMKRKRGIQLLEHLYHQTHPLMEYVDENTPKKSKMELPVDNFGVKPGNTDEQDSIYEVDNLIPVIKDIVCDDEDWILQKKERAKVSSCRVPLQIAFHNYVHARSRLREAILRYEPVSIDIIHKDLVKDGHRFDAKDLLKYLDAKCITTRTANGLHGQRRTKKKS